MQADIRLLLCAGFGVWGFFWGFMRLKRKRMIENIPTSTVRSLAMGLVELIGKARPQRLLQSPLGNVECVFYKYLIERYERGDKSGHWVTIAKGDSSHVPFYLDDDTGQVLVVPSGAECFLPVAYKFTTGIGRSVPFNILNFMEQQKIKYKSFFGMHTLRFREWCVKPEETVYVLGCAQKSKLFYEQHNKRLVDRLEELKDDADFMKEVDADHDGKISEQEWNVACKRVEKKLIEEELRNSHNRELFDVVIGKGEVEKLFLLSNHSQKGLVQKLFWQSVLGIYGGAVLAVVMIVIFLMECGILRF